MNYTSEVSAYANLVSKLSKEFCEQHPVVIIGGFIVLCTLPHIEKGVKYITDKYTAYCYFKVAAENGLLTAPTIESQKPLVLDEPVAA